MSRLCLRTKLFVIFLALATSGLTASIDFINRGSTLALVNSGSKLLYETSAALTGWYQQSIVKDSGNQDLKKSDSNSDNVITYAEAPYDTLGAIETTDTDLILGTGNNKVVFSSGIRDGRTLDGRTFLNSPIDLRGGTLNLAGDLIFSSDTTITSSGYIHSNGYAIVLGGDLQIPSGITLTFTSDGIFDGQGHTINIGNRSQLLIDRTASVTLRNLTIKNSVNTIAAPAIKTTNWNAKLTLENVTFALNDDWMFSDGQMFVYSDVKWTGSSQFIYRSPRKSYIMPHSQLYFGQGTSFYYDTNNSSTNDTSNNKDLIVLKDSTSGLFFDNCTLRTTHTGMRMTKGKVFFDNKVTLSSGYTKVLKSLFDLGVNSSQDLGFRTRCVHFTPDDRYLAVGSESGLGGVVLAIFEWTNETIIQKYAIPDGAGLLSISSVHWHTSGKYLATIGVSAAEIKIYEWDGSTLTELVSLNALSGEGYSVEWSPDGKYLAICGDDTSNDFRIYSWDGASLTQLDAKSHGNAAYSLSWSPDNNFIAVAGDNTPNDMIVYSWNGSTLTSVETKTQDVESRSVVWSPDGKYLASVYDNAGGTSDVLKIYAWTNSSLIERFELTGVLWKPSSIAWSHNGRYFSLRDNSASVFVYEWDGNNATEITTKTLLSSGSERGEESLHWTKDDQYLAVATRPQADGLVTVKVFGVAYSFDPTPQAFSQSIIFGNSSQGADYDADICLLAGARVELDGKANFDSLSKLDFADKSASFVLDSANGSRLNVGTINDLNGWYQQSIVSASGDEGSWLSDDSVVGFESGDTSAPTHLIYNNSNAIRFEAEHFVVVDGGVFSIVGTSGIVGHTTLLGRSMLESPINLSGATLNIGGDIMFSSGTTIASSGFFNPQGNAFILGGDLTIPEGVTITFSSSGIFDGQGHGLFFNGDGRIKLDPYVTVTFRNITLHNVRDITPGPESGSICMSPWRTRLSLQNVNMNLDRNFSFSVGELYIHDDVTITGTNSFNYTSSHAALIAPDSVWNFDMGTTFSYGPAHYGPTNPRNLIRMADQTSMLFLNGATLKSTTTGLQLTKGTLVVDHKVHMYNEMYSGAPATALSQAISFGDGTDELYIEILPAGSIELMTGLLAYDNAS